jgi:hypothetical protein
MTNSGFFAVLIFGPGLILSPFLSGGHDLCPGHHHDDANGDARHRRVREQCKS